MGNYWTDVKRTFIVVSGFFNWALYLLLFEMVRSRLVTDLQETLVLMWVLAALGGLRAVIYTIMPYEDKPSYEFRDVHFFEIRYFDFRMISDRIHNLVEFFINPYMELGWFLLMLVSYYTVSRLH